ncbi:MAG: hypothetical protein ACXWVG_06640 [Telluria sp.]
MKTSCILAALLLSSSALASAPPLATVEGNCQVADPSPHKGETVSWKGPCVDGKAQGSGVLELHVDGKLFARYEGEMQRGMRHGQGYVKLADNTEYEGGFSDNKYHGKGIRVSAEGIYEGDWKNGLREGAGKMKYALGGSYEGEWSRDAFHGKGAAVYAGGGKYAGDFKDGLRTGQSADPVAGKNYTLRSKDHRVGSWLPRELASSTIPLDKPYEAMTADEKRLVRAAYPMLAEDDEPPFPANGLKRLTEWISKAQMRVLARGDLLVHVKVDKAGNPVSASVYQTPHAELAKFVSEAMLREKYKPALCGGTPCEMIYPFKTRLTVNP